MENDHGGLQRLVYLHDEAWGYGKMFLFVLIGYLIVLGFDFRKIKNIPLDKALKDAE